MLEIKGDMDKRVHQSHQRIKIQRRVKFRISLPLMSIASHMLYTYMRVIILKRIIWLMVSIKFINSYNLMIIQVSSLFHALTFMCRIRSNNHSYTKLDVCSYLDWPIHETLSLCPWLERCTSLCWPICLLWHSQYLEHLIGMARYCWITWWHS